MAVRNVVRYSIHVTPVESLVDENNGTHAIIAGEVSTTIGGSGDSVVESYANSGNSQGYTDAAPYYRRVSDGVGVDISTNSSASFVFIKNTGKQYSTTTTLGDDFDYSIKVMSGTTMISILAPGECLILKDENGGIDCTGIHVQTVTNAGAPTSAGDLAAEFLVTTGI